MQCDREVIMLEMSEVYHFFNHRIIDVSSFIGVMERWLPESHEAFGADQKKNTDYNHRAVNDVESSIQDMQWIREHLLVHRLADTDGHDQHCLTMTIRGILHIILAISVLIFH